MPAVAFADMGEVVANAIHHAILESSYLNLCPVIQQNTLYAYKLLMNLTPLLGGTTFHTFSPAAP